MSFFLLFGWCQPAALANVELPAVFQDNMVVQRDQPISIWGHASPGEQVSVQLATESAKTTANAQGGWTVELKALPAGGPHVLSIRGANTIKIKNVEIGDVWLCAGQSNMSLEVKRSDITAADLASANPNVRYFKSDKILSHRVQSNLPGSWLVFNHQSVSEVSAVAYLFGKAVSNLTHVPIGLIDLSYGGAPIECFITGAPLVKPATAGGQFFPEAVRNGMILPMCQLRAKGVLWYQGESNIFEANLYPGLLAKLIAEWRALFRNGDLPFFVVQLPNIGRRDVTMTARSFYAEIRAAQARAAAFPNVYLTVNIDTNPGAFVDLHPPYKRVLAQRLAQIVMAVTYGAKLPIKYPTLDKALPFKNKLYLSFKDTGSGLRSTGGRLRGFVIAGANGLFYPGIAAIAPDGKHILVGNPAVPLPKFVHYAWADNPEANVYNSDNLPLVPFASEK